MLGYVCAGSVRIFDKNCEKLDKLYGFDRKLHFFDRYVEFTMIK